MPGVACCRDRCLPGPFHCTSYSEWSPEKYKQEPVLVPAQNAHSRNSQPRWYPGLSQQSKKILKKEIRPNRKVMSVWWCGFNPPSPDTVTEKQRDKQRPGRGSVDQCIRRRTSAQTLRTCGKARFRARVPIIPALTQRNKWWGQGTS